MKNINLTVTCTFMWVYYGILIKMNAVINQSTLNSKAKQHLPPSFYCFNGILNPTNKTGENTLPVLTLLKTLVVDYCSFLLFQDSFQVTLYHTGYKAVQDC